MQYNVVESLSCLMWLLVCLNRVSYATVEDLKVEVVKMIAASQAPKVCKHLSSLTL